MEPLDLREPFSIDPCAPPAASALRISMPVTSVARQKRQFEPSAHADTQGFRRQVVPLEPPRWRPPGRVEGQSKMRS
jgi:hypothetical protein